jgi:hypothetical protein
MPLELPVSILIIPSLSVNCKESWSVASIVPQRSKPLTIDSRHQTSSQRIFLLVTTLKLSLTRHQQLRVRNRSRVLFESLCRPSSSSSRVKLTSSVDIEYNDNALTIQTYGQVWGSGNSADSDLRAALFRLAAALDTRVITHRALAVAAGAGPYLPPTPAEYDAWMVDLVDPTVSDSAVDLETAVVGMYAYKKLTGSAQGMAQQKSNAKRLILSNTDDTLTQALLLASAPFQYLSHLQLMLFVRQHVSHLGRMTVALLDSPLVFTFCQL